jgi:hypothetical protein
MHRLRGLNHRIDPFDQKARPFFQQMSRKSKARIPGKKERGKERIERGSEVRQKKHSPSSACARSAPTMRMRYKSPKIKRHSHLCNRLSSYLFCYGCGYDTAITIDFPPQNIYRKTFTRRNSVKTPCGITPFPIVS